MSMQQQRQMPTKLPPQAPPVQSTQTLHKRSIIKKTMQVGGSTLGSRVFGIIREVLMVRYLGSGAVADAFITAWKIPNSLRKIFAEGALSAAFIPTLVTLVKKGDREQASGLMTLGFLVFEGIVLALCAVVICCAPTVVWMMAPGFSAEQIARTVPYLQILMPFIFFISSSALLAGALQSVNHFFVPAVAPILLNIVFIGSLLICLRNALPVETFRSVFAKFGNCLLSMSVMEVSLIIDTQFASGLSEGSIALINYANRFMGIPLGVFVTAFSTILLPHFSRVATYAPRRLSFYLLEATKLIFWVTTPMMFFMIFFSEDIFSTMFLSDKFPLEKVQQASTLLTLFVSGLFFFALNRIFLNLYYALHKTAVPAVISVVATVANICFNLLFITHLKAPGLALGTVLASMVQVALYAWYVYRYMGFTFYLQAFGRFVFRYSTQLIVTLGAFLGLYYTGRYAIAQFVPDTIAHVLLHTLLFWCWVGPLCMLTFGMLYYFRQAFGVRLYFID